eukprot:scaffold35519_cov40-Phaeocystis_antarctica.AAC.2
MERACMMIPRSSSSSSVTGSSTVRGSSRALAIMRRSLGRVSWLGVGVGVGVGERWVGDHVPHVAATPASSSESVRWAAAPRARHVPAPSACVARGGPPPRVPGRVRDRVRARG